MQAILIGLAPLLLAGLVIVFVHILYDNPTTAIPTTAINGNTNLQAFETDQSTWEMPNCTQRDGQ